MLTMYSLNQSKYNDDALKGTITTISKIKFITEKNSEEHCKRLLMMAAMQGEKFSKTGGYNTISHLMTSLTMQRC